MVVELEKIIEAPIIRMTLGVSGDGSKILFHLDSKEGHGAYIAYTAGSKPQRKLSFEDKTVYAGDWHPTDGSIALIMDGNLWLAQPKDDWFYFEQLSTGGQSSPLVKWIAAGTQIGFVKGMNLCYYDLQSGKTEEFSLPNFPGQPNMQIFEFSPDEINCWLDIGKIQRCCYKPHYVFLQGRGKPFGPTPNLHRPSSHGQNGKLPTRFFTH